MKKILLKKIKLIENYLSKNNDQRLWINKFIDQKESLFDHNIFL